MLARRVALAIVTSALTATLAPCAAHAQERGFALNRFDPADRGSQWFVVDSLDFRGKLRAAAGIVADAAHNPLVLRDASGATRTTIVGDQVTMHFGGSLVVQDRVRFGVDVPVSLYQGGDGGTLQGQTIAAPSSSPAAGDIRVGGDVRLFGRTDEPVTMALGVQVFIPSGSTSAFTSDNTVRVLPRALVAGRVGMFVYGGKLGVQIRPAQADYAGSDLGTELSFAASAGLSVLDHKLVVGPEIYGATAVTGDNPAFSARNTPLEALLGAHYSFWEVRAGLGAGPGLSHGYGSPSFRGVASIEWTPRYDVAPKAVLPEPDRDRDRVSDNKDACPDVPGLVELNGCPAPPPDRDHDAIVDASDACPDVAGVANADASKNGCPAEVVAAIEPAPAPTDRDSDGIADNEDACPDEAGPKDIDPKRNGCPRAQVVAGQIRIADPIKFRTGSATLDPASDPILDAILRVLSEHGEIKQVRIEGHTDAVGSASLNERLSANRAASVRKWLEGHGVSSSRLSSAGFGAARPLASNDSDDGRRENRRVEFHIVEK